MDEIKGILDFILEKTMEQIQITWIYVERPSGSFYISSTPVTFEQFDIFCEATGYPKPHDEFGRGNHPVINVTVADAVALCAWLSRESETTIRLPEEDEWEYAAQGGHKNKGYTYSGSNDLIEVGWYAGNAWGKTHEVATKEPNDLGIYDMSGNVWEWCGTRGVFRGGSWDCNSVNCRVVSRFEVDANAHGFDIGFRVLKKP